mmetsp:Transcript_32884/g.36809  ORF Transcript_32884/g.36809 Transcript_32884/m.36809 type:complete len:162 (-) Transcript_32884:233-718(-)
MHKTNNKTFRMHLSLPRLAILTFVVIGAESDESLPSWCADSTTSTGAVSISGKGEGCASVIVDDKSHCIFDETQQCVIKSGDPTTKSDYVGQPCCIIEKSTTTWSIQDNGVCDNPCRSIADTSSSEMNNTSTTETSGSGGRFLVAAGAGLSSMVIALMITI